MRYFAFAMRDAKTASFSLPQFFTHPSAALRSFQTDLVNEPDGSIIRRHSTDFDLYQVGEFDTDTGSFLSIAPFSFIGANEVFASQLPDSREVDVEDH
ncbi:MAG: nonstructural protein [Microvirus sp.]|nr:MAG: nonstructural protein [Microvirus sp.]